MSEEEEEVEEEEGASHLSPGEGQTRDHVLSVDAAQEGRRTIQTRSFLPQQELSVEDGVHLQTDEKIRSSDWRGGGSRAVPLVCS